MTYKF
jgi:magnesium-transporting ATPase (P-type)